MTELNESILSDRRAIFGHRPDYPANPSIEWGLTGSGPDRVRSRLLPLYSRDQPAYAGDRQADLLCEGAHGQATFRVRPKQGFLAGITSAQPLGEAARRSALGLGDFARACALRVGDFLHALDKGFIA